MSRTYAGTAAVQRSAERRERLLDAGAQLLGAEGLDATTVRAVCKAAHLTPRYFYESFADRDALLLAVYDRAAAEAATRILAAVAVAPADAHEKSAAAIAALVDQIAHLPETLITQETTGASAAADGMRQTLYTLETQEHDLSAKMQDSHPRLIAVRSVVFVAIMAAIGLFILRIATARPVVRRVPESRLRPLDIAFGIASVIGLIAIPVYLVMATAQFALRSSFDLGALFPLLRASAFGHVLKLQPAHVLHQAVVFGIGHPQVGEAIVVEIFEHRAHGRGVLAALPVCRPGGNGDLLECSIVLVMEEEILGLVVGHVDIREAVAIEISRGDPHGSALEPGDP